MQLNIRDRDWRDLALLLAVAGTVASGTFIVIAWMVGDAQLLGDYTPFLWGVVLLLGGTGAFAAHLELRPALLVCGLSLVGFAMGETLLQVQSEGLGASFLVDYWDPARGGRLSRPELWASIIWGVSLCLFWSSGRGQVLVAGGGLLAALGALGVWGNLGLWIWMQDFGGLYSWSMLSVVACLWGAAAVWAQGLIRMRSRWLGLSLGTMVMGLVLSFGAWKGVSIQERLISQELVAIKNQDFRRVFETRMSRQLEPMVRMANRWREFGRVKGEAWKRETLSFMGHFPAYSRVLWVGPQHEIRQESRKAGLWTEGDAEVLLDPEVKRLLKANKQAVFPWLLRRRDLLGGGVFLQAHLPLYREAKFDGTLIAVMRLDEVVQTILRDSPMNGYSFSLTQGEEVIWERVQSVSHLDYASLETVDLSGVILTLSIWPDPEQFGSHRSFLAEGVLVFCLGLSVLLAWLFLTVGRLRSRAHNAERMNDFLSATDDQTKRETVELSRSREEARIASAHKSEFLASMSHEIRTPLNVLVGVSDLMAGTKLTKVQKEYVQILRSASTTLLSNINDVLDFSKIESGKLTLVERPFELRRLVDDIHTLFSHMASEKGLSFDVIFDPQIAQWVIGDPERLRQILTNLVGNAIKFTREGGVVLRVEQAGLAVRFEVEDSGVGIEGEDQEKIFEVFHQAGDQLERGSGLGLSISQKLVTLMGGAINVDSVPGEGSAFSFLLEMPPAEGVGSPAKTKGKKKQTRTKPKVLVAEDNPLNQKVIRAQLENLGYTPTIVNNGEEAVAAVKKKGFNVVLMDCRMPVLDGYSAARSIREWETEGGHVRTPIIALTAHATTEDEKACLDAGMRSYLPKPVSMDRLASALRHATEAPTPRKKAPARKKRAAPESTAEDFPTLDRSMLFSLHMLENDENFLPDLIEIFAKIGPETYERAAQEAGRENLAAVVDEVHSLKSSAANLGARRLVWMCEQVESMGEQGDVERVREFLPRLETEIEAATAALQGELNGPDEEAA